MLLVHKKWNVNLKCIYRGCLLLRVDTKQWSSLGRLSWKKNDVSSSRIFETWKKICRNWQKTSQSLNFEKLLFLASSFSTWDKCAHFWTTLMLFNPQLDLNLEHSSPNFTKKKKPDNECSNLVVMPSAVTLFNPYLKQVCSGFRWHRSYRNTICHQQRLMIHVYGSLMEVYFSPTLLLRAKKQTKTKRLSGSVPI